MMIIAILAAIAIPSYLQYLSRGHRSEARAALTQAAQWMERWRTERNSYQLNGNPPPLPQYLQQSPPPQSAPIYNITVVTPNPASYTLSATPVNPGPMGNDACGVFTLDNTGLRVRTGPADFNLCWGR